mmetsp:Transcript_7934/g.19149  ORF Transcript_7934/g.19149 Transcript_7934/m.19149 type:complete len:216 (+) Transcript_7934:655-1302(+)
MLGGHLFVSSLVLGFDKIDRCFAVNRGQRVEFFHELGTKFLVVVFGEQDLIAGNGGLGICNHVFQHSRWVGSRLQQPVIKQSSIVEILGTNIVRYLQQKTTEHALGLRRPSKENLDRSVQQVLLDPDVLEVVVIVDELFQCVGGILNKITAFSEQPNDAGLPFSLVDVPEGTREAFAANGFEIGVLSNHEGETGGGLALYVLNVEVEEVDHALGN